MGSVHSIAAAQVDSLARHWPLQARVVKVIGNEMDMTLIDLTGVLPSATIMVVTVTGTIVRPSQRTYAHAVPCVPHSRLPVGKHA